MRKFSAGSQLAQTGLELQLDTILYNTFRAYNIEIIYSNKERNGYKSSDNNHRSYFLNLNLKVVKVGQSDEINLL